MNSNRKLLINNNLTNIEFFKFNPFWLIGFIEADGFLFLYNLKPYLTISQKSSSLNCLNNINNFFQNLPNKFNLTNSKKPSANFSINKKTQIISLTWINFDSLHDFILPFFEDYSDFFFY